MRLKGNLVAVALGLCAIASFAQTGNETRQIKEEGKTVFNPHWFVQFHAGAGHTLGEISFSDLISPAAAIYFGYQFTPVWGLRAGLSGAQAKGGWVTPQTTYKYDYMQGNVDVTLDLGSLFCKYSPKRVFNPYLFAGVGLNGAYNNDDAVALAAQGYELGYLWNKNKTSPVGRAGLGIGIRLYEKVFFNIEANANIMSDKFNSKKADSPDWQFNLLGGFTIKLGKPSKTTEPVYYEPVPEPVQIVEERKEEPAPEPAPAEEVTKAQDVRNIFFTINSAKIRATETPKVDALVSFLKEHESATVSLCGYADKQTGTPAINERLSKRRAIAVADALKANGIAADRITVDYKGDTVQPFATMEENRVTICIAE